MVNLVMLSEVGVAWFIISYNAIVIFNVMLCIMILFDIIYHNINIKHKKAYRE